MTDPALNMTVGWIATFEDFHSAPHRDARGWSIGYGATYTPDMRPVTASTPDMSAADARAWLGVFVAKTLAAVRQMVHVPITDHQAMAITSLAYDEGTQAIRGSSLMLALNQGRYQEAADGLLSWCYAAGGVNVGLVQRRKQERTLFLTPDVGEFSTPIKPASVAVLTPVESSNQASSVQGGLPDVGESK